MKHSDPDWWKRRWLRQSTRGEALARINQPQARGLASLPIEALAWAVCVVCCLLVLAGYLWRAL